MFVTLTGQEVIALHGRGLVLIIYEHSVLQLTIHVTMTILVSMELGTIMAGVNEL